MPLLLETVRCKCGELTGRLKILLENRIMLIRTQS
uniref:Uncharacterized protein n=1 Tax=Siphoviridae sp. ctTBR23 TaxID=2825515 RepID=A0A8S5NZK8_9CAUD|nr:MAG TPA: hypothetical protein [Siphoviridae sp. ctTBR23]DAR27046.1 MAG TPA: hypothetical protein [Caudoviricetes sp.]